MSRGGDALRLAVLSSRIETIVRKMANTLFRTARSGVLNTAHDFSCAILTRDGRILAAAESIPIHVLIGPDLVVRYVASQHPNAARGDVFLHNSPYHGSSHAADHCLVAPVIDEQGVHRFWVLTKAHQADCGNATPTTYVADCRDVYEEGALIFPAVQVQRDYKNIDDIIRMCMLRIRVPEQWWGDYLAALGAIRIAERELLALGEDVGWAALDGHTEAWLDYSERRMIEAIRRLPSGRQTVATRHDPFPGVPEGIDLSITVTVDHAAATIEVDLRDNPDCLPCGLNMTEGCSNAAAMLGVYNGISDHTVPINAGSFRRVRILLREGCVVGIPVHPFSCSVATTNLADRVSSAVQRAIGEIADGFGLAECGVLIPPGDGVISGTDPRRNGARFVNQVILGVTGGAGAPKADGWLTIGHTGSAGLCRLDVIEVDELQHPIVIHQRRLVQDSEGAGTFRGSPGVRLELGPIEGGEVDLLYAADGTMFPPQGCRGGEPGRTTRAHRKNADGSIAPLPACAGIRLASGETAVSDSPGWGGYGPPLRRDPERVRHDVAEGWISRERAFEVYGVAIDADGAVMAAATSARRATMEGR